MMREGEGSGGSAAIEAGTDLARCLAVTTGPSIEAIAADRRRSTRLGVMTKPINAGPRCSVESREGPRT